MKNPSQLLKFTKVCMQLATQQVPLYSSRFSKHTFTQPQLITLYCLKIKLGTTYRDLTDWLYEMPRLRRALGLKRLPHFTTVQKAFQRLSTAVWRVLQRISAALSVGDGVAALDASGWDRSHASRYYTQRVKLKIRALKTTLLVDTRAQTVLDVHVTTTRKHDTQIAPRAGSEAGHDLTGLAPVPSVILLSVEDFYRAKLTKRNGRGKYATENVEPE